MKRSIKLLILLVLLCACAGGYLLVSGMDGAEQVSEETGDFALTARTAEELTGLEWAYDGESYHLVKADGRWTMADNAGFPVKQSAADSLGQSLIALQAGRKLENVTDASLYGLDSPAFTVTASWADGTSATYAMGDATPFADGYYLSLSGQESTVYTTATGLDSLFRMTLSDLAELETIPSVDSVTRITVGSTLDAHYEETSLTINDGQHWYDAENRALDGVEDLVEDAQNIAWDTLIEACATEEQLLAWQLDEASATALTLYHGDEPALTLLLGASTDDGSCYARLPGSAMVYTIEASAPQTLLNATEDALRSKTLVQTELAQVREATLTTGGVTLHIQAPAEEGAEAAGDGGQENPNESIWSLVTDITASAFTQDNTEGETILLLQLTTTGGQSASLTVQALNADNYTVTDGTRTLLVSTDKVDKLVRAVKAAQ